MRLAGSLRSIFTKPYESISATEVHERISQGAVLVDVREPGEWQAGHAPGARHIPLAQLAVRASQLPTDTELITVCRSGGRSAQAAVLLTGIGHKVANLAGGMSAWAHEGLPVITNGARPGRIA